MVLETARHLQRRGHLVRVLTTGDPRLTSYEGIPTQRLPISRYQMNFKATAVLRAAEDCDLIHTFTYHAVRPASLAARRLGKPVVCGVLALFGSTWLEMRGPFSGRVWRVMERYLLGLPLDARIYLSRSSLDLARAMGIEHPSDRILDPGISLDDYHVSPDKSYVLFSGKLDARKGIDTVLAAAVRLPSVPFRILGWGARYQEIESRLPSNVTLEPFKDRAYLAEVLAGARIFLFPSKAETFGLVVAEAMAAGCAVISTLPLPFEGVHLLKGDEDETTRAVESLWRDTTRCQHCAAANQRAAQRYSWPAHVESLEALYSHLIDRSNGKP